MQMLSNVVSLFMPIETFSSMHHVTKLLPSITALFYPLSMPRIVVLGIHSDPFALTLTQAPKIT